MFLAKGDQNIVKKKQDLPKNKHIKKNHSQTSLLDYLIYNIFIFKEKKK